MGDVKWIQKFADVVELVKKGDYDYVWVPQYLDDLPIGPRNVACKGVPKSHIADFIMRGFTVTMHKEKCIKCGACWVYCCLGVIREVEDGYFEIDEEFCRPCGICSQVCPADAIEYTSG